MLNEESIEALIQEMTLEEKAFLCSGGTMFKTKALPRLGIPALTTSDGPHGLRLQKGQQDFMGRNESVPATSFPAECLTGCSFDPALIEKMARLLAQNARHEGVQVVLGPGVNMKRSPLCGRNFEYFSEDPCLAGELGAAYVKGLQEEGVGASLKHFLANNQETRRRMESSEMDERTMREIYAAAFETVVKRARPWTVMAAYNQIDGVYATENAQYLRNLLRKEWGYDGLVVSDWVAVHNRTAAVRGGCDLTMPADAERDRELVEAVKVGVLDEEMLNEAVRNLLRLIAKCQPAAELPQNYDYDAAHKEAVRAAAESMVLLKNEGNTLPIQKGQKVALIGKFAQQTRFQGGGSSKVNPYRVSSLLEAAGVEADPDLTYFEGFGFGQNPDEEKERAAAAGAQAADVAIVFAGLPEAMESEGFDRWVMKLPICQNRLIEKVCAVQPNTIVVLQNGGAVEMPWVEKPKAILEAYLGGEGAAEAIWAVLTGAVNPSGRLAETFPLRYEDTPAYLTWPGEGSRVEYTEGVYIGYRWYATRKMPVLFPFGHGLSYTTFAYSDLKVSSSQYKAGETVEVCVTVTNTGDRAGKEVVQLYVGVDPLTMGVKRPIRELRRFAKVALQPGESKTVNFSLDKRAFAIWDKDVHDWRVPGGTYFVEICKNAQEVLLSQPIQAENEYLSTGQVYDMMTPIIDIEEHPVGAAFLRKVMPVVEAMIARLGQTNTEMPYGELMPYGNGLKAEPLMTLKRLAPTIPQKEWDEFLQKINEEGEK